MRRDTRSIVVVAAAAAGLVCALACSSGSEAPAPGGTPAATPAPAEPAAQPGAAATQAADQIFATRCFTCHGATGAGDGPGSAGLTPPPRNFHDAAWQASVSDEHITQIILYGGAAVGRSPMMPGNPDLTAKPEVVAALVVHVRSLAAE